MTDWIEPPSFSEVPLHSTKNHACMPMLQGYDVQMHMVAPTVVRVRNGGVLNIPICARAILPVIENPEQPRFVATNTRTGKVYRGIAFDYKTPPLPGVEVDPIPRKPTPNPIPIPPDMTITTQFTTDLARSVQLPATPGIYEVYLQAEDLKSNTVTIEVQSED